MAQVSEAYAGIVADMYGYARSWAAVAVEGTDIINDLICAGPEIHVFVLLHSAFHCISI